MGSPCRKKPVAELISIVSTVHTNQSSLLRCCTCKQYKEVDCFAKKTSVPRGYRLDCRECTRDFRARNRDKISEYRKRKWKTEKFSSWAAKRLWEIKNNHKRNAYTAAYKASKLRAAPSWADQGYIDLFYTLAKVEERRTGRKCHVDHIVPLNSNKVCGLHVEHNLQIMFGSANISKNNRYWPDMW